MFPDPYPRVALEWLIEAAPEVILDASEDPADAVSLRSVSSDNFVVVDDP